MDGSKNDVWKTILGNKTEGWERNQDDQYNEMEKMLNMEKTYAWMTYIVPHFRYGELVFHDIRNEHEPKTKNHQGVRMQ